MRGCVSPLIDKIICLSMSGGREQLLNALLVSLKCLLVLQELEAIAECLQLYLAVAEKKLALK